VGGHPPYLGAGNASPFTLDGTRTYRVGEREVALVDPGPDVELHVRALASWVEGAEAVRILLTHGHHDHAGAARALSGVLGVPVFGPAGVPQVDVSLADGDEVPTDLGALVAVHTPGHSADHMSYRWPARRALFVGDLMLGRGDTTWVGEYPGCVADYLASLQRVRTLAPAVLYPAHGPPIEDVPAALERYERHRRERIQQVEVALAEHPEATAEDLVRVVYGIELPSAVRQAATLSLQALLDHVRSTASR